MLSPLAKLLNHVMGYVRKIDFGNCEIKFKQENKWISKIKVIEL